MKKSNLPKSKSIPATSEAEGQDYILSSFNYATPWDTHNLTPTEIEKYKDHWVAELIRDTLKNLIFQGQPIINCLENGKSREDLAEFVRNVADKIDLLELMKTQFDDECNWGDFLRSVGWENQEGNVTIQEVRCLPPNTFRLPGKISTTNYIYGQILKGIVKYEDGSIHYFQSQAYSMSPIEIKNCEHIKSPKSSYYVDGVPILNPLYQLLPDLNEIKAGWIQSNKRANILFVRDNNPQNSDKMPDGKGSRWNYIRQVLQKLSNNNWFGLVKDMEPIELKGQVSKISIDSIYLIIKLILMCYSPASFLSMGETNRLGGSTTGETTLVKAYVTSQHDHLKRSWEKLFEELLERNYIFGIKVQIILPQIKPDNDQLNKDIAVALIDAIGKYGLVLGETNEIRNLVGLEDITPEALQKARDEILANRIEKEPINQPDTSTDITSDITQNQAVVKTREEIQTELESNLDSVIKNFITKVERVEA